MSLESAFDLIGRINYKHRSVVLLASLAISIFFGIGLVNLRLETDPENLWVSHDSEGYQQ